MKILNSTILVDYEGFGNTEFFTGENYSRKYLNTSEMLPFQSTELNLGLQSTLKGFAQYISSINAKYYTLIIWGHGKGDQGVCFDGNSKLTGKDINEALNKLDFDLLILDACEMICHQFLTKIGDVVPNIMGSEKDIPDRGFDYSGGFTSFSRLKERNPINLAKQISKSTISFYTRNPSTYSVQISIINLNKYMTTSDEINESVSQISNCTLETFESGNMVDLGNYLETNNEPVFHLYQECIIDNVHLQSNTGVDVTKTTGISYRIK